MEKIAFHNLDFSLTSMDDKQYTFHWDSVFMIDDVKELPNEFYNMQIDFILVLFCNEGKFQMMLDQQPYSVNTHQCIVCLPGVVIHDYLMSPDVNITILGFSWAAIQQSQQLTKYVWRAYEQVQHQPVVTLTELDEQILDQYYRLTMLKIQHRDEPFIRETSALLFQSYVFEFLRIFAARTQQTTQQAEDSTVRQGDIILRRFLGLLSESDGRLRSVSETAELLNLSPKYLSKIIKTSSGRTPIYWIHEYTVKSIERQLTYSDLTVKQIAHRLGFPSLSFFAKFVREQLGMSPTAYRERHRKE